MRHQYSKLFVVRVGSGAAAGRRGSGQTEASDGEGHHGRQDEED